jgi:hypothetical protein
VGSQLLGHSIALSIRLLSTRDLQVGTSSFELTSHLGGDIEVADRRHIQLYYSHRGIPLVFYDDRTDNIRRDDSVLTVENYLKWYNLYVVHPNGTVQEVPFPSSDKYAKFGPEYATAYCDHVPNPRVVSLFAEETGYRMCEQALEIIIGRWEQEYKNNYAD